MWNYDDGSSLYHHGVKGQKWGVRRYQNLDGTLTDAGKKRLYKEINKANRESLNRKKSYNASINDIVENEKFSKLFEDSNIVDCRDRAKLLYLDAKNKEHRMEQMVENGSTISNDDISALRNAKSAAYKASQEYGKAIVDYFAPMKLDMSDIMTKNNIYFIDDAIDKLEERRKTYVNTKHS